jgi:ketosteroid isomerase-like protein
MTTRNDVETALSRWTAAEAAGDSAALQTLLADDFTAVGPLGFTLTKQDWLDRHAPGQLTYETFDLDELQVRVYDDAAVAIARQSAQGTHQGQPVPSALRITLVLTRADDRWRLAVAHMSFIAGTPGAPPIPGRG